MQRFIAAIFPLLFLLQSLSHATSLSSPLESTPIIAGTAFSHSSETLKATRRFMVDLPENYHDNTLNYPTLYVIDSDFQFHHVSMTAKNLARMGKIPPVIVVGIANQGNADYIHKTTWAVKGEDDFGGAVQFYQYITEELVPLIDEHYRTNASRILSGYSLGGLFSTYSMMQENTPFNAYFAMSPSFWVDDYSMNEKFAQYLKTMKSSDQPLPALFLSVANEQGMGVKDFYEVIKPISDETWQLTFRQYPDENHFSTSLPAISDALAFLFDGFYEDGYKLAAHESAFDVLKTFKQKQHSYNGFRIEWLQAYKFARYVFGSKQTEHIDQILTQIASDFPDSLVMVTNYLAKGYNATKQYNKAQEILLNVKQQGEQSALWHHQLSLALYGLNKPKQADTAQAKAMELAQMQKLPMWQIWEMKN